MTFSLLYKCEPPAVVSERESGVSPFYSCVTMQVDASPRASTISMCRKKISKGILRGISGLRGVGRALSSHFDACLIMQPYSRLVIDCNRRPGSETSILPMSEGTNIPGNQKLSAEDTVARVREIFDPYHRKISAPPRCAARCWPNYDHRLITQLYSDLRRYSTAVARKRALQP